jgi:hypothetical protein
MFSPSHVTQVLQHCCIALDLKTEYEGEHTIFVLLSLANLAQNDVLQFPKFTFFRGMCRMELSGKGISLFYEEM